MLTYPLIGNYGVPSSELDEWGLPRHFESSKVHIRALIVADYSENPSHYQSHQSLGAWLKEQNIPALYGVDTRAVTKILRNKGITSHPLLCCCHLLPTTVTSLPLPTITHAA